MEIELTDRYVIPDGKFCWKEEDDYEGCGCFLTIEGKYGGPNDVSCHCKYVMNMHPGENSELDGASWSSDDEEDDGEGFIKHDLCPNPYRP